jgi:hypothetical protein
MRKPCSARVVLLAERCLKSGGGLAADNLAFVQLASIRPGSVRNAASRLANATADRVGTLLHEDHAAIVSLMDKNGPFVAPFSLKRKPGEAAAELRRYL